MEKNTRKIEPGTPTPDPKYHLEITADGPYLVYGNPPLQQEIFVLSPGNMPKGINTRPTTNPLLYAAVVSPKIIRIATVPITMPIGIRR